MEKIELEEARSGADLILDTLLELGISTIFGYPGGAVLPLYDAIYKNEEINHILSRHEQGSLHEAEGYAKSTGKLGVALVTSGPGATNAITGIADAMSDSVPLLVFTGQVATSGIGKDAFQEADIVGITIPITKYNYQIRDTADIPRIIREAVHIATTGRPGPVVIDLPKDVVAKETTFINDPEINLPSYQPTLRPNEMQINKILKQLGKAKKPVIVAGGGVAYSESAKELVAFAERYQIPVVTSLLGQGTIATSHPLFLGMGGMHGSYAANIAMTDADFMIAIGCRFDDRLTGNPKTFAKNAKVVHIDVDPAEINKNIKTDASVIGDVKVILRRLNARLDPINHDQWIAHVERLKDMYPLRYNKEVLTGPYIMEKIYEVTKGEAIITTDVGQHQMWAAQYYKYKRPRQLLTSGGLGTMGYGLGAAIGAKMGCRDKLVINIGGDGCFRMNMNEIATATRYNIPIIQIVFNNHVLGMVRQWQTLFYGMRYSQTNLNDQVDFVKVAEGLGAKAYRITTKEEVEPTLLEAISLNVPVVIDCQIGTDDKVFPMVPAGKPIEEAFDEVDLRIEQL